MPESPRPGSSSGSSSSCWPNARLDPGVEAGAEPRRRRRLARHRPGQVAGERLRVVAQPGQRRSPTGWPAAAPRSRATGRAAPPRAAARSRRPTAATWSSSEHVLEVVGASSAGRADRLPRRRAGASTSAVRCEIGQGWSGERSAYGLIAPFGGVSQPGVGLAAPGGHRLPGARGGTPTGPRPVLRCAGPAPRGHGEPVPGAGPRRRSRAGAPRPPRAPWRPWPARRCRRACARPACGRSRASPRSAAGITDGTVSQLDRPRLEGNLRSVHADQEHRRPTRGPWRGGR